jgi:two-component system, OmpR family, response regulator ResD
MESSPPLLDAPPSRRGSVLVVDDEPTTAEVVSEYLRRAGYATTIVSDGAVAVDVAASTAPDLVLLDAKLPGLDGLEVMRRMRAADSSRPAVIMTSEEAAEADRILGLRLGADDYVVKPFSSPEVVARVDAVLRRMQRAGGPQEIVLRGDLALDPAARRVTVRDADVRLTDREFDLLLFLARHPGRAFTRDELMQTIWQYSFYADSSTVTVHIRRLRTKIEDDPGRPRYVQTVHGVGYRFAA